jgi:pimeloyl-ACP methyl ester carboxylesterase
MKNRLAGEEGNPSDGRLRLGRRGLARRLVLAEGRPSTQGEGHDAYPVTLTGLGERVHRASPEVDLETHITDLVTLVEFEDLRDVVLLGHSYGGLVVTGATRRISKS